MSGNHGFRTWLLPVTGAVAICAFGTAPEAEVSAYDAVAAATSTVGPTPAPVAQVTAAKAKQSGVKLVVTRARWSANKDQIDASATVTIPNDLLSLSVSSDAQGRNLLLEFRHSDGSAFAECELDLKKAKKKQVVFAAKEIYRKKVLQTTIGICDPDLITEVAEQKIPDVRPGDRVVLKDSGGTEFLTATFVTTK